MIVPSEVIAMGVVMPVVDGVFLLLRFYTRSGTVKYGVDDYLILFAFVSTSFNWSLGS